MIVPAVPCLHSLETDRLTPGTLYLGCEAVHVSLDSGTSWSPFDNVGLPTETGGVRELTVAPTSPTTLHAGIVGGVYSYTLPLRVDLALTKDDGITEIAPGTALTYVLQVRNLGPDDAVGAHVTDRIPSELACQWTCSGSGVCTSGPVVGDVDDLVDLDAGQLVTYTVDCTLSGTASGSLFNTASVAAPAGTVDPELGNNSASDVDAVLTLGACGTFEDRALSDMTVNEPVIFEACNSISTGPAFQVLGPGDVLLRAGAMVLLGDGTSVETGAALTVVIETPVP